MELPGKKPLALSILTGFYNVAAALILVTCVYMLYLVSTQGANNAGEVIQVLGPMLIVAGVLIYVMRQLSKGSNRARVVWLVLQILSLVGGLAALARDSSNPMLLVGAGIGIALNLVFFLILNSPAVRAYCSR